jgi:WD40 repeat protein
MEQVGLGARMKNFMHLVDHHEASCLALSADGTLLATGGKDGLRLWSAQQGTQLAVRADVGPVTALCFTPEGEHLLIGGRDGTLRRWAFPAGADVQRVQWEQPVIALAVTAHGGHIAVGLGTKSTPAGTHVVVLAPGGTPVELLSQDKTQGNWSLAFSPDGRTLAALNVDGHTTEGAFFAVVEVATGTLLQQRLVGTLHYSGSVSFSPAGHLAVAPNPWRDSSGGVGATGFAVLENCQSPTPLLTSWWEHETVFLPDGSLVGRSWSALHFRPHLHDKVSASLTLPEGGPEVTLLTAATSASVVATAVGDNRVLVGSVDELLRHAEAHE